MIVLYKSSTLSKAERKQHNGFWKSNQLNKILRLQGILTAVINVTFITLGTHSRGQVFECFHPHMGTKTQRTQSMARRASVETSHMSTESTGIQELPKTPCFNVLSHRHKSQEYGRERGTHLMWPNSYKYRTSCT